MIYNIRYSHYFKIVDWSGETASVNRNSLNGRSEYYLPSPTLTIRVILVRYIVEKCLILDLNRYLIIR